MANLSKSQQKVVDFFPHFLMSDDREMTISGFAGSGKTWLVRHLAAINNDMQKFVQVMDEEAPIRRVFFTATTNKAADVLFHMLGHETFTIHALLGLRVRNDYKTGRQELVPTGQGEPLHDSIVFIDEASMINQELLKIIRKTTASYDCKVVYIGDQYQLPPVMEEVCPVFRSGENVLFLDEIHRQAEDNPIIQLSAEYRDCLDDHTKVWPELQTDFNNIFHYESKHDFFDAVKNAYTAPHATDHLKIIAWSNQRVREYNSWIRRLQGLPPAYQAGEMVVTNKPLFSGKRIMAQTDTIHEIEEVRAAVEDGVKGHEIFLRDIEGVGFFQPWDWQDANKLAKKYANDAKQTRNWAPYFEIMEQWADLRPIHASTVHKAQGSTYTNVFVDLNNIGKNNKWREVARLVYVAITRASHSVHLFGDLQERYTKEPLVDHLEAFKDVKCI